MDDGCSWLGSKVSSTNALTHVPVASETRDYYSIGVHQPSDVVVVVVVDDGPFVGAVDCSPSLGIGT